MSSMLSQQDNQVITPILPKKQQWSLIYQQQARQNERIRNLQRMNEKERKSAFKKDLDKQISSRNNFDQIDKQTDAKYYQYIIHKTQEQKQKQQAIKNRKIQQRKQMQAINQSQINNNKNFSNLNQYGRVYNMQIGQKNQQQRQEKQFKLKKQMADALDQQLKSKQQMRKQESFNEHQQFAKNMQYQHQNFNKYRNNKKYGQNESIYQFYQQIEKQREQKDRQMRHKLVEKAAFEKQISQRNKQNHKEAKNQRMSVQMREALEQQVNMQHTRKQEYQSTNPEEHSYSLLQGMFTDKRAKYSKKQYAQYLKKQIQTRKLSQIQQNRMSEEQYLLNLNQLNRAVNGTYSFENYKDRSIASIGQKIVLPKLDQIQNQDASIVKNKLNNLYYHEKSRSAMKSP